MADLSKDVASVNEQFLEFLQSSYVNIVSSTRGSRVSANRDAGAAVYQQAG